MALINPRDIQNKTGYSYEAGSLTRIYAEDYQLIKDTLRTGGSEIFPWVYNVTTTQRDALNVSGSGFLVFNTTLGSIQYYTGNAWVSLGSPTGAGLGGVTAHSALTGLTADDHLQYLRTDGTRTGSNLIVTGSIVSASGSMTGTSTASAFSGSSHIVPNGGTFDSNTSQIRLYTNTANTQLWMSAPLGIVFNTDLRLNGSINTVSGSHYLVGNVVSTGSIIGTSGSFSGNILAGSFIGSNSNYISQGVLPVGSIPNLTAYLPQGQVPIGSLAAVLPQGQLITGSLPNAITISGDLSAANITASGSLQSSNTTTGIAMKNGNTAAAFTNNAILFGYNSSTGSYRHAVKTRHNAGATGSNAIDFFIWTSADAATTVGTTQLMSIEGRGVGIKTANPQAELDIAGAIKATGSITTTGSLIGANGSFSSTLIASNLSGTNTGDQTLASLNGLPNGVIPLGSLTLVLPQGVLPVGSLANALPQGVIPVGSLSNALPQGVLPIGSIPSLSASYIPQGQLVTGSMPNTITISGSVVAPFGSHSGSLVAGTVQSIGSFYGWGGTLTGLTTVALPQGVLPAGSLTNALPQGQVPVGSLSAVLPQGQLITGSLPNTINISGSVVAQYGSFATNVIAGSYTGYGGNLTGLPSGGLPQGAIPYGSLTAALPQGQLPTGSLPNTITISGSVVAPYGSFSGSIISGTVQSIGSIYGWGGTLSGITTIAIPQGVIPAGSLVNSLPQGVLPAGSLTNALPQGILPIGSIPQTSIVNLGNITIGSWGIANLNAGSIASGTLSDSRLPSSLAGKTFTSDILGSGGVVNGSFNGSLAASNFVGAGTGLTGVVKSVIGTSNRVSVSQGSIVDIDSAYVGQATITTLGTITTGTWNTTLNAGSLSAGTVSDSRLPSSIAGKTFTTDILGSGGVVNGSFNGSLAAANFVGAATGLTGVVKTVVGTSNRISVAANGSVVDIDTNYVGQATITTLGTITTGTWNTSLNAGSLTAGTVADARLPSSQAGKSFSSDTSVTGNLSISGSLITPTKITLSSTGSIIGAYGSFSDRVVAGSFVGYGGGLTGLSSGVQQVFGTSNRVSVTQGSIVDIDSAYVGQATITTLGTIATGTWNTGLNAGSLTSGVVSDSRLPTSQAGKTFTTDITGTNANFTGSVIAGSFSGVGTSITLLNATNLSSGTVNDSRLPTTLAGKTFSTDIIGTNAGFTGSVVATNLIVWSTISGSTTAVSGTGYITGSTARTLITLPTTVAASPVGTLIKVVGSETGGWAIRQNANQFVNFGAVTTTSGTTGSLESSNRRDVLELLCVRAGSEWNVTSAVGNIGVK